MPRFRAELDQIPGYKAGRGPLPRNDDLVPFKVSSNENPYQPLPSVVDVVARAAQQVNRYPDPASTELIEAIAMHHQVPASHVAVATGAVALCYQFAHATSGRGDKVMYAWRSFEAYPIVAAVAGATAVQVPLTTDFRHDLAVMAGAITEHTRLIFVCSPNNPTGTVVTQAEFEAFMERVPPEVLVVLDEAYIEFCSDPSVVNGLATYSRYPNVAVLRTFSKAYGLAGLRVGYAIAEPLVINALNKTALPFGVSNIAQAAGVASLQADAELKERVDKLVAARDVMQAELSDLPFEVSKSQANFVWLATGDRTADFAHYCESNGLTVRPFAGEGVRVTVAEPEANERFVQLARSFA